MTAPMLPALGWCTCGHEIDDHDMRAAPHRCTGTLATLVDADYADALIRDGADPREPCLCGKPEEEDEAM